VKTSGSRYTTRFYGTLQERPQDRDIAA
jgi:hypothetical protein